MSSRACTLALLSSLALVACSSDDSGAGGATDGGGGGSDAGAKGGGGGQDGGATDGGDAGSNPLAWASSFTTSPSMSDVFAIAADASGVVVVGDVNGSLTIGGKTLTADDSDHNAFIAKLDPTTGAVLWADIAHGSESSFEAVAIDPTTGDIVVTGEDYGGSMEGVTYGGVALVAGATDTVNGHPVTEGGGLVYRLDTAGNVKWGRLVEATDPADIGAVVLVDGTAYVGGAVNGDVDFSGHAGTRTVLGCGGPGCVALAAFDSSGTVQWAEQAPSTPQRGTGAANPAEVWLAADPSGHLVMAVGGSFEAGLQADANQLVLNEYDLTGAAVWTKTFPTPAGTGPSVAGLGTDASGNLYVTGSFATGLVLGPTTIGESGDYVARFSSLGAVSWVATDGVSSPVGVFGNSSLAVGTKVLLFGNGSLANAPDLPGGETSVVGDELDPATGTLTTAFQLGVTAANGGHITVSSTGAVFIAAAGGPPTSLGNVTLANTGVWVARLN